MRRDDAPALAGYRSDPDVARYQDWDVPFTLDDATRFVGGMAGLEWPVLDDWYQVAIDLDGRMIGDVGVHRSADGREATIGYTLAREHHGLGYATESVGAVIDHLFAEGTERIHASIDPANAASARLLTRLGFRLVRRSTAVVRGETLPDDQYVLARGA
jgi:aminoglycoside 6'-N-acetyltransferase